MKYKHTFEIDRSLWRTGESGSCSTGEGSTCLKNKRGFKCCLGFLAESLGIKGIKNKEQPYHLSAKSEHKFYETLPKDASDAAIDINDNPLILERKSREESLTKLFEQNGIKVKFTGRYTK